jgi:hypothetical protein
VDAQCFVAVYFVLGLECICRFDDADDDDLRQFYATHNKVLFLVLFYALAIRLIRLWLCRDCRCWKQAIMAADRNPELVAAIRSNISVSRKSCRIYCSIATAQHSSSLTDAVFFFLQIFQITCASALYEYISACEASTGKAPAGLEVARAKVISRAASRAVVVKYTTFITHQHRSYDFTSNAIQQLEECIWLTTEKVKESPCEQKRIAHDECMRRNKHLKSSCGRFAAQLKECIAKHVGRLD